MEFRAGCAGRAHASGAPPALRLFAVLAVLAGLAAGCGHHSAPATASAPHRLHVVTIRQIAFQPPTVSAAVGDTVEWRNQDLVPHTVTARAGGWDSGSLSPDSSWRLVVAGTDSLPYFCRFHTTMRATVLIER